MFLYPFLYMAVLAHWDVDEHVLLGKEEMWQDWGIVSPGHDLACWSSSDCFALNAHVHTTKHTAALPVDEPFSFTETNKQKISLKAYYNCCTIKTSDKLLGLIASSVQSGNKVFWAWELVCFFSSYTHLTNKQISLSPDLIYILLFQSRYKAPHLLKH